MEKNPVTFEEIDLNRKYRYRLNLVQQFWSKYKPFYFVYLKTTHQTGIINIMKASKGTVVQINEYCRQQIW